MGGVAFSSDELALQHKVGCNKDEVDDGDCHLENEYAVKLVREMIVKVVPVSSRV